MELHDMGIFVTPDGYISCTRGLSPDEPREPGFQWVDPNDDEEGPLTCIVVLKNCPAHTAFHIHKMLLEILVTIPEENHLNAAQLVSCGEYVYMPQDIKS